MKDIDVDMEKELYKEIPCRNEQVSRIMEMIGRVSLREAFWVY
jgi:hypothetical protein